MEKLWAPWRMQFIEGERESGCFLCRTFNSREDRDNLVLARRDSVFLIMNRYPYANGHLMAVPGNHVGELECLSSRESSQLWDMVSEAVGVLKKAVNAQGFNIGINLGAVAGAGVVDHLHVHIVPRWLGDTNYMPVLSDTKIMSEHLTETYNRLLPYFQS